MSELNPGPSDSAGKASPKWQSIHASLRDAIISHRLAPGTKLPEDELASIYSVSRTIIRAALHALAHDRLVRLELNRGAFVAQPSVKDAREVFDARVLIEPELAGLAAKSADRADLQRLHALVDREQSAWSAEKAGEAISLAGEFHTAVAEITNQSVLTEIVRDLVSHSSLIVALYAHGRRPVGRGAGHAEILEAIEAGKPSEASKRMRAYLETQLSLLNLSETQKQPTRLSDILN